MAQGYANVSLSLNDDSREKTGARVLLVTLISWRKCHVLLDKHSS